MSYIKSHPGQQGWSWYWRGEGGFKLNYHFRCFLVAALLLGLGCRATSLDTQVLTPRSVAQKSLANARTGHSATVIADGASRQTVLFVGGGGSPCSSEMYQLGQTSELVNTDSDCRVGHTATLLADRSVLIAGGVTSLRTTADVLKSAEVFSLRSEEMKSTGSLETARYNHNATFLGDGTVLITGGFGNEIEGKTAIDSAELYDPEKGVFIDLGRMNFARAGHTSTLLSDGSVLIVGGSNKRIASEQYDPTDRKFYLIDGADIARSSHSATRLNDHDILLSGGTDENALVLSTSVIFNVNSMNFSQSGRMNFARAGHTVTTLPNDSLLFIGGNGYDQWGLSAIEIYDVDSQEFKVVTYLAEGRLSHTATFIDARKGVLVAGGWGPLSLSGPKVLRTVELVLFPGQDLD